MLCIFVDFLRDDDFHCRSCQFLDGQIEPRERDRAEIMILLHVAMILVKRKYVFLLVIFVCVFFIHLIFFF